MTAAAPSVDLGIAGPIATITINNPRKRNSLDLAMFDQLHDAAARIAADATVRVAVLRGAGDMAFSAGADFDTIAAGPDYVASFDEAERLMNRATAAVASLAVPVIGALRGVCMGGGVHVALSADFRLAADDLRFGIPAVTLGIVYPLAAIEEMIRLAGPGAVKKLLLDGAPIGAAEALAAGFVEEVVPVASFEARLGALADRIAGHPAAAARAYKRIVNRLASGTSEGNEEIGEAAHRTGELAERLGEVARMRAGRRSGRGAPRGKE